MSQYADKTLTCRDCGAQFAFSSGEQEFYASRGFSEPSRCSGCRAARKAGREGGYGASSSYGSDDGYGGSSYGGGYGSRSSGGARQMFKTICAQCGVETEVPFEPRQGRPVYCRECFQQNSPRR